MIQVVQLASVLSSMWSAKQDGAFSKSEDLKELKQLIAAIDTHVNKVNEIIKHVNELVESAGADRAQKGAPEDSDADITPVPLLDAKLFTQDGLAARLKVLESQRDIKGHLTKALKTRDLATLRSAIEAAEEQLGSSERLTTKAQKALGVSQGALSRSQPSPSDRDGGREYPQEDSAEMMLIRAKAALQTEEINLEAAEALRSHMSQCDFRFTRNPKTATDLPFEELEQIAEKLSTTIDYAVINVMEDRDNEIGTARETLTKMETVIKLRTALKKMSKKGAEPVS